MKEKLNKILTIMFVTMSLIISSTLPIYAEDLEDKNESVEIIANKERGDQSVTIGDITASNDLDGGTYDGQSGSITYDVKYGDSIKLALASRIGFTFDYWQVSSYEAGDFYIVKGQHNTSVKVEIDNKTIDSIEIIIHGLFLATIAYLIIKSDKKRYH